MLEIVQSGGWLMLPLLLCSVVAAAISIERAWALRSARVVPPGLFSEIAEALSGGGGGVAAPLRHRCERCALGRILLVGADNAERGGEVAKEAMEDASAVVVHDLERYLTALGTVASISPLLGLLGTVVGMIRVFAVLMESGVGGAAEPGLLAGGISAALVTTAAGLAIAIPALVLHRYLVRKVDTLVVAMERQAGRLVETLLGDPAGLRQSAL